MVVSVELPLLKYLVLHVLLCCFSVAFSCKCSSTAITECCRDTNFTFLFTDSQTAAILNNQPRPFYIITPEKRKQQLFLNSSDISIVLNLGRRNESRKINDNCYASSCAVKSAGSRKKDAPCQVQSCTVSSATTFNATFQLNSQVAQLTKLQCIQSTCYHILTFGQPTDASVFDITRNAARTTPPVTNEFNTNEEDDQSGDGDFGAVSAPGIAAVGGKTGRSEAVTEAAEAAVLDTVWLVVILGGIALSVLVVVGVVFACFARRDRRQKTPSRRSSLRGTGASPSVTSWQFQRAANVSATSASRSGLPALGAPSGNPRFDAAVNEFYRAALTPDDDDDAASGSDDSMTDGDTDLSFGRQSHVHSRRHRRVRTEDDADEAEDDAEAFERSSAQRTIKFSAAPTFMPSSCASSTSAHRVLVEAVVEPRPAQSGGTMPRVGTMTRGPSATPLPVRSILKKGGSSKKSADVAVGTTQTTSGNMAQTPLLSGNQAMTQSLPDGVSPAVPRRRVSASSTASSSSSYSLVECEDKSVGVTEAELDALAPQIMPAPMIAPVVSPVGVGLFVTPNGQLVTRDGQLVSTGTQFINTNGHLVTLAAPFVASPAVMQTSAHTAHSHSPSTNLSPASTISASAAAAAATELKPNPNVAVRSVQNAKLQPQLNAADCETASVGGESSECDCMSQSAASDRTGAASATGTASQNNDEIEKPHKLADGGSIEDRELDAVSLSELDLFNLARNFDTNFLGPSGAGGPLFAHKLVPTSPPSYLPNPSRLNRLSSLASDSNNPSALNTPSPPTVTMPSSVQMAGTCQPKLELRDASLELNLNLNIAPQPAHVHGSAPNAYRFTQAELPLPRAPRGSRMQVETDLDSELDCTNAAAGVGVGIGRVPSQRGTVVPGWADTSLEKKTAGLMNLGGPGIGVSTGSNPLWQARQPWAKGAADHFDFS